jgi:endoglucanase
MTTYSLVHGTCGSTATASFTKKYLNWIKNYAYGIGNNRAVIYLEEDSLITTSCLNRSQLYWRLIQLSDAEKILEALPHTVVYVDAGSPDGPQTWQRMVRLLDKADVCSIQGFFDNSTHFDWTTTDIHWGQLLSDHIGCHPHFVVNSGTSGRGPLVPKDRVKYGNEVLCNPAGRGAGPIAINTKYRWLDGLLWFNNIGNSAGQGPLCQKGSPPTAVFWPHYAISLMQNETLHITGPRYNLLLNK